MKLTRDAVEGQIAEMWQAISTVSDASPEYRMLVDAANKAELKLFRELKNQEILESHAEEMLTLIKEFIDWCEKNAMWDKVEQNYYHMKLLISKMKGEGYVS